MISSLRVCLWVLLFALLGAPSVRAQSAPAPDAPPPPAHLSLVEGQVFLEREGRSESAVENVPLLDGDRIRTERGRAEVMFGDGSLLHLDEGTTADLLAGDLIRLLQGRITLVVLGARDPSRAVRYQVDAPAASAQSNGPGEYRVTVVDATDATSTELAVVRGDATLANDAGSVNVRAGERSVARDGEAPSRPQYFNSARWDQFDRWSATRRDAQIGTTSARYLPQHLEPYSGTFDRYGTWRYETSDGYVWFPTVSAGWRPYSVGYWRQYDQWDSFWIAGDPWGWPTHHYGRWGFSAGLGWYWMPARSWGAAFVYWALGGDYISWCPLGRNDYPVFGHWGVRGVYVGLHDGWHGWTVIPRRHFGSAVFASRVAVDGRRFDSQTRSAFVAVRRSPVVGRAVPRGQAITATSRTEGLPPSGGARGVGAPGRDGRAQQRGATADVPRAQQRGAAADTPRAEMRGQTERSPQTGARSPQAAPAAERDSRRTVPGAPAGGRPDNGVSAPERQTQRSGWSSGRSYDAAAESGTAGQVGRRSVPEATPRVPTSGSPRAEPWPSPREPARGTSSSGAQGREYYRPTGRPAPDVSSMPDRGVSATPRREAPPAVRSSSPSSRYDPGSSAQRSPDRGSASRYDFGSATQRSPDRDSSPRYDPGSSTQRSPDRATSSQSNAGSATQRSPSRGTSSQSSAGSATQRSPGRGASSSPRGRGGAPE